MRTLRRLAVSAAVLALVAAGGLAAAAAWSWRRLHEPYRGYAEERKVVTVASGSSARSIIDRLVAEGVLRHALLTRLYYSYHLDGPALQAGEYEFSGGLAAPAVLDKLVRGEVVLYELTLIEGLTIEETARHLAASRFGAYERFLAAAGDPAPIRDLDPLAPDLEGYLFPDTYSFARGTPEAEIVARLVATFRQRLGGEVELRPPTDAGGFDLRRLVTLASIVEKEARLDSERPLIAAVYANRLERGIGLYADPTVIYALKNLGRWDGNIRRADLELDHPYNTYRHAGLPPGPIGSPGLASMLAAARPADAPYLYFVSRNDGSHVFATTLAEHNRNVERLAAPVLASKPALRSAAVTGCIDNSPPGKPDWPGRDSASPAMRPDDRFGDYLLFRRLGSTPLGTTYRAGRLQARAIDRVVLLHRFDGDEVDRPRLAADAAAQAAVLERLTAPHFANGLGMGTEEGVPYVAYDYLLGRNLRETLCRATEMGSPPEAGYLLALVEQTAASLAAAGLIRIDGIPIRHGFLVPELLLLSAEGRVYPLGFAHGPALLRQERLIQRYAAYLAPEARLGDRTHGDDVYSLAAILFEGLTGAPPDPDQSTATQVDQALLGVAGKPLAPAVQDLLKSGLAPAGSRPELKSFHHALRRILDDSGDTPSQFQLAFFLHQLFRDELEAEAVEMRDEKTTRFHPLLLTPPEAATDEPDETTTVPDTADVGVAPAPLKQELAAAPPSPPPGPASRSLRQPSVAGLAVGLALAALATVVPRLMPGRPAAAADEARRAAAGVPGPDAEAELSRLVAERAAGLQQRLEQEYEPRLSRLRQQLLDAQAARAGREAASTPSPRSSRLQRTDRRGSAAEPAATGPRAAPGERPARAPAATTGEPAAGPTEPPAPQPAAPAAAGDLPQERDEGPGPGRAEEVRVLLPPPALDQPERPEVSPPPTGAVPDGGDDPAPKPAVSESAAVAVGAAPEEPEATVTEQVGTYTPPRLLEPPRPRYPPVAQRLGKTARVQVRVLVDPAGRVGETELISAETGFGFDKAALQAAAKTRWEPARRDGEATSAWAVLTIDFRL